MGFFAPNSSCPFRASAAALSAALAATANKNNPTNRHGISNERFGVQTNNFDADTFEKIVLAADAYEQGVRWVAMQSVRTETKYGLVDQNHYGNRALSN